MALYEKTASELSELLGKKEISAVELAKDVFARTKAVEDKGSGLRYRSRGVCAGTGRSG